MGDTHYNELANDGRTIFMATRSTGQIEEGAAGVSIAAIDGPRVSWRFKPLEHAWPLVLITRLADRRLVTRPNSAPDGSFIVRAKVIGDSPLRTVQARMDDGAWTPMQPVPSESALWQTTCDARATRVVVRVHDDDGPPGRGSCGSARANVAAAGPRR